MLETSLKLTEFTEVQYTFEKQLGLEAARRLRGAIAHQIGRHEFHHHAGRGLVYQHPLIRYDVRGCHGLILGIGEGAFLLRSLPAFEVLRLGPENCRVIDRSVTYRRIGIGPCDKPIQYRFRTPFLALNQTNFGFWQRSEGPERDHLLERIVIGNLLSLSKAIRLQVVTELFAKVDLAVDGWFELKPGVELLGFRGTVQVNFNVPQGWGIGKSSARGFGTLICGEPFHG